MPVSGLQDRVEGVAEGRAQPSALQGFKPASGDPPGEVTSRRTASVSLPRRCSSSAVPASVCTTSSALCAAGMPWRTPASICASATSAT